MKRALERALFVLGLLASLIACATPTRQREPVAITFACRDYQRDWYEGLAQAFHDEHPHIAVQLLSIEEILEQEMEGGAVTVSSDDIYKLARAADSFVESPFMLGERPQDVVLDLNDLIAHDDRFSWDDFYPGTLSPFRRGDKLWGLPFEANTFFVYYDPALFDEAGVLYPKVGWTWDDLLDAAVRLTARQGDLVERYGYVDQWSLALLLLAHQEAGGLIETQHEVHRARLDDPGVAHAVRWYASMVREHGVMPDPGQDPGVLDQIVYDESPGMWTGGSWEWDSFARRGVRVVPFPEKDGKAAATLQVRGYLISAGTAHSQEAWRWIEWLARQPPNRYAFGVPARRSVVEATDRWGEMDESLAAAFQYNLEHAVDYPPYISAALQKALQAALRGEPIEPALDEGQARANELLAQADAEVESPPDQVVVTAPDPTPTPGGTEIRFHVLYVGDLEAFRPLVEQFHRMHPEIHVELGSSSDWSHAAQAAEADCFVAPISGLAGPPSGSDGATEALLSLDPLIAADPGFDLDVYYPAFLDRVRSEGSLWGLPLDSDAYLLYYDLGLFDRAGVSYPAPDWTPQQLVEATLSLADPGAPEPLYGFYPRHGAMVDGALYVAWLGGQLFDASELPTFDHPSAIEATSTYASLIAGASPPRAQERTGNRLTGVTLTITVSDRPALRRPGDDVAMWTEDYEGNRGAPELGTEVGVAPFPVGEAGFHTVGRALYISKHAAHPQACWTWIRFVGEQPQALHHLPVRRDLVQGGAWSRETGDEMADAWRFIVSRRAAPLPRWFYDQTAEQALYWFDEALVDVLAGVPAATALRDAQVKALAFVECVGEQENEETWRTCARQVDPDVVLSDE